MLWFTADWHLGHERIISLCNRPFRDAQHMNEMLIKNHNELVSPDDVVIVLGDVAMGKISETLPLVSRFNGYKVCIPGNHDRIFSGESEKKRERFLPEYRRVFDKIVPEVSQFTFDDVGLKVVLCHFPYTGDSHDKDRHADKRPFNAGLPLIHGHVHEKWRIKDNQFNVGVDVNDFRPVSRDTILNWIITGDPDE